MLDLLREMFPGRATLTTEEVAQVLGRTGAGGIEATRQDLAAGKIVPGLRRTINRRWLVPITALAAALDDLIALDSEGQARPVSHRITSTPSPSPTSPRTRRGRPPDSVRATRRAQEQRERALAFWSAVLAIVDADRLAGRWSSPEPARKPRRI